MNNDNKSGAYTNLNEGQDGQCNDQIHKSKN